MKLNRGQVRRSLKSEHWTELDSPDNIQQYHIQGNQTESQFGVTFLK